MTVRRADQHAGQSSCQCVIPEDVLIQLFPPDDERLSLEKCRGGKINTWKKWKKCVKLVENPQFLSVLVLFCHKRWSFSFKNFMLSVCISYRPHVSYVSYPSYPLAVRLFRRVMCKACSKKDRTFAIKTLFYILSTVPFKVFPSIGNTPSPTFLPLLECFLERTFCDGVQFSYRIFLNLRVFK
jgi:hypothetical protein